MFRRRAPWLLLGGAWPAWAGLVTEVPEGTTVRVLICGDLRECAANGTFIDAIEGDEAQPYIPIDLVFAQDEAAAVTDSDDGAVFRGRVTVATTRLAAGDRAGAVVALDEAEGALRRWAATVPQDELFAFQVLRAAAADGGAAMYHLRAAAAIADVGGAPVFPLADPALEERYHQELRKLRVGGTGRLELEQVEGAVYTVDGVPIGESASIDLLPGVHRVTAVRGTSVGAWRADAPVLPGRSTRFAAVFGTGDDLPWVSGGLAAAFDTLTAEPALTEMLAAWCRRHGVERLELLRVEELSRPRNDVPIALSAPSPHRPPAAAGAPFDFESMPGTYEQHVLATWESERDAHTETFQRMRVVFFDPRTRRFATDPGSASTLLDVVEPPRLELGVEAGWARLMDKDHVTLGVATGWHVAGAVTIEVRVGVAHAQRAYLLTPTWSDRNLYRASVGFGVAPLWPVAPVAWIGPEVWVPVAIGARGEAGLEVRVRRDVRFRLTGIGSYTDHGLSYGAAAGLHSVF